MLEVIISLIVGILLGGFLVIKIGEDAFQYVHILLEIILDILVDLRDEGNVDINKFFRLLIERLEGTDLDTDKIKDLVADLLVGGE